MLPRHQAVFTLGDQRATNQLINVLVVRCCSPNASIFTYSTVTFTVQWADGARSLLLGLPRVPQVTGRAEGEPE